MTSHARGLALNIAKITVKTHKIIYAFLTESFQNSSDIMIKTIIKIVWENKTPLIAKAKNSSFELYHTIGVRKK